MQPGSDRPLFSQVGRRADGRPDASSRLFNLVIVLGMLLAAAAFLVEIASKPAAMRFVEVDMGIRPTADGPAGE